MKPSVGCTASCVATFKSLPATSPVAPLHFGECPDELQNHLTHFTLVLHLLPTLPALHMLIKQENVLISEGMCSEADPQITLEYNKGAHCLLSPSFLEKRTF
eukprot:1153330-Pelagomonas_calceolata.AAC.1